MALRTWLRQWSRHLYLRIWLAVVVGVALLMLVVGSLFDAQGNDVARDLLTEKVAGPMTEKILFTSGTWARISSTWR